MTTFTAISRLLLVLYTVIVVSSFIVQTIDRFDIRREEDLRIKHVLFAYPPKSNSPKTSKPSQRSTKSSRPPIKQPSAPAESLDKSEVKTPKPPSFAIKNIQGRNTIICRDFKIDAPKNFEFLGSFRSINQLPTYPLPEIAFIGRSNVGKSSLINCLTNLNKKVVITSKTPGRTQGINLLKCNDRQGDICIFSDLPGYGFAKISKEVQRDISQFVNEYLLDRDALKLCMVLLDARREPLESDYNTLKSLAENGIPFAIVLTKADLVSKAELPQVIENIRKLYALPKDQPVAFSATEGIGRKDVWRLIKNAILDDGSEAEEEAEEETEDEEEEAVEDNEDVDDIDDIEDDTLQFDGPIPDFSGVRR